MFQLIILARSMKNNNSLQAYLFPDEKVLHLLVGAVMFVLVMLSWIYEHDELIKLGVNKWYERRNKLNAAATNSSRKTD